MRAENGLKMFRTVGDSLYAAMNAPRMIANPAMEPTAAPTIIPVFEDGEVKPLNKTVKVGS